MSECEIHVKMLPKKLLKITNEKQIDGSVLNTQCY